MWQATYVTGTKRRPCSAGEEKILSHQATERTGGQLARGNLSQETLAEILLQSEETLDSTPKSLGHTLARCLQWAQTPIDAKRGNALGSA